MIKLLALDIDGTILKKDFTMSQKVKNTLLKTIKKGVKVLLVTGRMHCVAEPVAKMIGIDTPILSYHGALIRQGDKVLHGSYIEDKLARKIITELKNFDIQINAYMDDTLYSEADDVRVIKYCKERDLTYKKIDSFDEIEELKLHKFLAIGHTPEETTQALEHIKKAFSNDVYAITSTPIFCEITKKGATKGNGIRAITEKWDISLDETMAIGDQNNDIELLKAVNVKVAMGNATDELKKVANHITKSVNEDGAAVAIEKFILGEQDV